MILHVLGNQKSKKQFKIRWKIHTRKEYAKMMRNLCKNHQNLCQKGSQNHPQIEKLCPRRPYEAQK